MVEPHDRLGDDEPALGEPQAGLRQRHARLEGRGVVVGEVADDGGVEALSLREVDEARTAADERAAPEPTALDRLEQEAATAARAAQAQVEAERRDQVGGDGGHGVRG